MRRMTVKAKVGAKETRLGEMCCGYYVGPDGCMVRNNYAPDGYWADDNGCWAPPLKLKGEGASTIIIKIEIQ